MADIAKSQARQVSNLGNSPAGQTGYPTGSRGNSYYEFGSTKDPQTRVHKNTGLKSPISMAGAGTPTDAHGDTYYEFQEKMDASLARFSKTFGLFGGANAESGSTQADTGSLPVTAGSAVVTHYYLRAQDQGCLPTITYVYWVSTVISIGSYGGSLPCGGPLINLTVLSQRSP